jgi:hypothetical protein
MLVGVIAGIRFDLAAAFSAPDDQPDTGYGRAPNVMVRRAWISSPRSDPLLLGMYSRNHRIAVA